MSLFAAAAAAVGVANPITNPYRLVTKAEVLAGRGTAELREWLETSSTGKLARRV
jgi:hypothetical protein